MLSFEHSNGADESFTLNLLYRRDDDIPFTLSGVELLLLDIVTPLLGDNTWRASEADAYRLQSYLSPKKTASVIAIRESNSQMGSREKANPSVCRVSLTIIRSAYSVSVPVGACRT